MRREIQESGSVVSQIDPAVSGGTYRELCHSNNVNPVLNTLGPAGDVHGTALDYAFREYWKGI